MAITLKRQLNDDEKKIIIDRHGRKCFATGHEIPSTENVQFDHIRAFSLQGESELDNIAPMCEHHNKAKGTLPLEDYRVKLKLEEFFKLGDRLTLKDLLKYFKDNKFIDSFGERISYKEESNKIKVSNHIIDKSFEIQVCPTTNWKYFYASLPITVLNSDDDEENSNLGLQPRYLIFDKVFKMFRHFMKYPVLQPSIGRIKNDQIVLFDGQHKAAALLWNNKNIIECKVYIDPDIRILNQANIAAHDEFAQTRFYSSIMILKLGNQFGKEFEEYKNKEDNLVKTEVGFLDFLQQKDLSLNTAERNKRFRSYLYKSVLEDDSNKLKPLISVSNRSSNEQPITIDMLSKSIFGNFLYTYPLEDNLLSDKYKRDFEFNNVIRLLNLLHDLALKDWDPKAKVNDHEQLKLKRIFSSKSIMAWSEIFKDAVCVKLDINDTDERTIPFYRELTDDDFNKISAILSRLINWQMWISPKGSDIDTVIAGSKTTIKDWYRDKGLTVGFLLGAPI